MTSYISINSAVKKIIEIGRNNIAQLDETVHPQQNNQSELDAKFSEIESKNNREIYDRLTPHLMDLGAKETLVVAGNGQFVKNPAGANYNSPMNNPFIDDGVQCAKCLFFQPANNSCTLVEGFIESGASCRFYVISLDDLNLEK